MADEPVEGCGCARCANAALRKVSAERDALLAVIDGVLKVVWDASGDTQTHPLSALGQRVKLLLNERERAVARSQREACAQRVHDLLTTRKATAVWVCADDVRATPLASPPALDGVNL